MNLNEVEAINHCLTGPEIADERRALLALATMDDEWLHSLAGKPKADARAVAIALRTMGEHVAALRGVADAMDGARTRVLLSLCARADSEELAALATAAHLVG